MPLRCKRIKEKLAAAAASFLINNNLTV